MASPQLENGYTRIANEILEQMARVKLSPTQYRILFVVWRYTYGFKRKSHHLSLSFLAEATGCDRRSLQRDIKKLVDTKVIIEHPTEKASRVISFNKRFNQWGVGEIANGETANVGEIANTTVGETANGSVGEIANQERKKKNLNKTTKGEVVVSDDWNEVNQKFMGTFTSPMNPTQMQIIESYLKDGLQPWHIIKALEVTAENKKTHFNYTKGVLNNWVAQKAFTREQVESINQSYKVPEKSTKVFGDEYEYKQREVPEGFFDFVEEEDT